MRTLRPRPDPYKSDRCQRILTKLRSTVHVMDRPAARLGSRPHPGPPPRRRACRARFTHRRARSGAVLHRRSPAGPSRPHPSRGRPPRTHKGLQSIRNTGAASTASGAAPRPLPAASRPPLAAAAPPRPARPASPPNALKIQKETTHRRHSRKRPRPTPSRRRGAAKRRDTTGHSRAAANLAALTNPQ